MTSSKKQWMMQVQIDCLERWGDCDGCPNELMSQQCQVKYTEGVAEDLGLPVLHKMREARRKMMLEEMNNVSNE